MGGYWKGRGSGLQPSVVSGEDAVYMTPHCNNTSP